MNTWRSNTSARAVSKETSSDRKLNRDCSLGVDQPLRQRLAKSIYYCKRTSFPYPLFGRLISDQIRHQKNGLSIIRSNLQLSNPQSSPAGTSPLRRANSIRRTSSLDVSWPDGWRKTARYDGRCRDIHTPPTGGDPLILGEDCLSAALSAEGRIESIASTPAHPQLDMLLGKGRGDNLRRLIDKVLPAERDAGSGLYLLLDDLVGFSLVSSWVWSTGGQGPTSSYPESEKDRQAIAQHMASIEGVCIGFAPGSNALSSAGRKDNSSSVVPLLNPADTQGFHILPQQDGISMRRARRIDVWRDNRILIDATFQDSATIPGRGRVGVHEYVLKASVHPETLVLLTVDAQQCILPFPECHEAPQYINRLVGTPMQELRRTVPLELRRTLGCTHLNDALRALAEVPALLARADAATKAATPV